MNREKLNEFTKITAHIGSCMSVLIQAQDLLVELMCSECDLPLSMKPQLIEDMIKAMGINLERLQT